jgi:hypothetical protein
MITSKSKDSYLLLGSLFLGLLFTILFFKKALGISYLIFVFAFYVIFLWLLRKKTIFRFSFGWFLSLPILALSATYFFFSNPIFSVLNFLLIPVLIVAQTLLITGENIHEWFMVWFLDDVISSFFTRLFSHIQKLFSLDLHSANQENQNPKSAVIKKILLGLLISLPLLLIILILLLSADLVFSQFLKGFLDWIKSLNLAEIFAQLILFLVATMLSFSYLWSFLKSAQSKQPGSSPLAIPKKTTLDPVISITVISLVNLVYLLFISVQLAFMMGAIKNGLPANITYAQYARKGFFELLAVTLINFTILLVGLTFKAKENQVVDKTIKTLHTLLVLFTIILLGSSYMRMSLYEAEFGYTYLRILTMSFMILLFVMFVVALFKIWNERIGLLKTYIVLSVIAYMVVNFIGIDALITKKNLIRFENTGELDTYYLTELSYSSIPVLVDLCWEKGIPEDLLSYIDRKYYELEPGQNWQSFNLSKHLAWKALVRYKTR